MRNTRKIIPMASVLALLVCVFLMPVYAKAKYVDNPLWIESTSAEVTAKYNQGDTFVAVFYNKNYSSTRQFVYQQWMQNYNVTIYGVEVSDGQIPNWFWNNFAGDTVYLPATAIVANKQVDTYSSTEGTNAMQKRLLQVFGITDEVPTDFIKANSKVYGEYCKNRTTAEALYLISRDEIDAELVALADQITAGKTTDLQKTKAIYDWVATNIYYNYGMVKGTVPRTVYGVSALGTYKQKNSVCDGYASLTMALCHAAGIPCRKVTGFASGNTTDSDWQEVWTVYSMYLNDGDWETFESNIKRYANHAWNEVYIDGEWIILDTTWGSGNRLDVDGAGNETWTTGSMNDIYFAADLEQISASHLFWTDFSRNIETEPYESPKSYYGAKIGKTIYINWNAISGVNKYAVFRKTEGGSWILLAKVDTNSFGDSTIKCGNTYTYSVRCMDDAGEKYVSRFYEKGYTYKTAESHTPGIATTENRVEPTCTAQGFYDEVTRCSVCDELISKNRVMIPAIGHLPGEAAVENNIDPSCTKSGSYDNVIRCQRCNVITDSEHVVLPALGHIAGTHVRTNETEPTCTEEGGYEDTVSCTRCGDTITSETVILPPKGHTPMEAVEEIDTPADCTTPGIKKEVVYCSDCGKEISSTYQEIPATGHQWGEWEVLTEPTETEAGVKKRVCAACSEEMTESIPATGHIHGSLSKVDAVEPTCSQSGNVEYYVCECGSWFEDEEATTEITDKNSVILPMIAHADAVMTIENRVEPTCISTGSYDKVYKCPVCGKTIKTEKETIPLTEHEWGEWVVSKKPTLDEIGEETRSCNHCTQTEKRSVPKMEDVPYAFGPEPRLVVCVDGIVRCYVNGVRDDHFTGMANLSDGEKDLFVYVKDGVQDTSMNGFVWQNMTCYYVKDGVFDATANGFVSYNGGLFYVVGGRLERNANGLIQKEKNSPVWYYCANGQVVKSKSGLAQYKGSWFYVKSGELDTVYNGFVEYYGGVFLVARGRILKEKSGLVQDPNSGKDWYYLANGQVQKNKTGVVFYNKASFYVNAGKLASDFSGTVTYNGKRFNVKNGRVQ